MFVIFSHNQSGIEIPKLFLYKTMIGLLSFYWDKKIIHDTDKTGETTEFIQLNL